MLKRTLVAIAVVALVAVTAQAQPEIIPHATGGNSPAIKVNMQQVTVGWPFEYKALDLCVIPIFMNVGYYVQVEKCNERKINLVQVDCGDMQKGSDWPCYQDCEKVKVRANFEVKVGLSLRNKAGVIDAWDAYFKGTNIVDASGNWNELEVCVEAWKAKLWNTTPGTSVKVGDLVLTVKPNV